MSISVAIIEDQKEIREMQAVLINGSDGFICKHTFENAEDAIFEIPSLMIDVVLLDIHLPQQSGVDCLQILKPLCTNTHFIMCTSLEDTDTIFSALKAGASGYITKSTPPAKLLEAITDVYNGGSPMSSMIARKVVSSFLQTKAEVNISLQLLSTREQEILALLSKGLRYKEIAEKLFLSIETVRTHIRNIYEKLQVNSRTDALNKVFKK